MIMIRHMAMYQKSGRARRKVSVGCRQLGNDNHIRLSQTLQAPPPRKGTLICHSSITDVGGGVEGITPKEMKLLRTTSASPFSVCPRVKKHF